MAIADGLATGCANLQASGGIQHVFIREWNSTGSPDRIALAAGNAGKITSIADSGGTNSTWGVFETKIETAGLAITSASVGNANTYECTLTMNFPEFDVERRTRISEFEGKCLQVMVQDTNSTYFVLGIGNVLTGGDGGLDIPVASHIGTRPQTFAKLGTVEGGTGAAFSDESGLTVTITCTQYELPRAYVPAGAAVSIAASGLVATIT